MGLEETVKYLGMDRDLPKL